MDTWEAQNPDWEMLELSNIALGSTKCIETSSFRLENSQGMGVFELYEPDEWRSIVNYI